MGLKRLSANSISSKSETLILQVFWFKWFLWLFIRWISFEKVINALVAEDIYHQSLKQLRCYASFIKDDQEFDTMMQFYHDLGIIVKHRETVILDAQWLINLFRQLITIPHYENAVSYTQFLSTHWLYSCVFTQIANCAIPIRNASFTLFIVWNYIYLDSLWSVLSVLAM